MASDTHTLKYDGTFDLATGRSRREVHWRNKETTWGDFLTRLSQTHRTAETLQEYLAAKKTRQAEIKDVGGYVGGYLTNGRRKASNVLHRQLITLDIDFAKSIDEVWDTFTMLYGNAAAIYTTHKHSADSPRLRLIIPLDRPVAADEYTAIARRLAGNIGIDLFDDTTYEACRLMYWPSTSKEGEYVFEYQDGEWLSADEVLAAYRNWRDTSEWPASSRTGEIIRREIKKQGDPVEKPGLVGAFCRVYSIEEAIEVFLSEAYGLCDIEGRYTYKEGSTAAGMVVYEGKYAYSHHGTDPASGKLCNAFDLVRLHRFGLKDEDVKEEVPNNRLPSYVAMLDLVGQDGKVRKQLAREKIQETQSEFGDSWVGDAAVGEADDEWLELLEIDKTGSIKATVNNFSKILENDPALKSKYAFDEFRQTKMLTGDVPWRKYTEESRFLKNNDEAGLVKYIEATYDILSPRNMQYALMQEFEQRSYHPVRDYLSPLKWDGEARVDTLLIDYLGAEDCEYTRAVTRKALVAAVARVFDPGIKYDYVLTLVGGQGIGKSTILKRLGREWFSDSFNTVSGKESFEQLQGSWIIEMGELAGLRKVDVEATKLFISKREDRFRPAYGKEVETYPRQCVFFATTNRDDFLRDETGNRRFWPVNTQITSPRRNMWVDLDEAEIGQIWAEAVALFKAREPLYLSKQLEEYAKIKQAEHRETDERTGMIHEFLDMQLPGNWEEMDPWARHEYWQDKARHPEGVGKRDRVCVAEIWCECLGKQQADMSCYNTKEINAIMRGLGGWEQLKSVSRFRIYGQQKAFRRCKPFP